MFKASLRAPLFGLLFAAVLGGCATPMPVAMAPMYAARAMEAGAPQTEAAFVAAVKADGVKLTSEQLAEISAERHAHPNGEWAARPALNLSAEQNLDVHFHKHASQFHPSPASAEAYLKQAIACANGERGTIHYYFDITSFTKGYQTHVVRWDPQSKEFCAVRTDGAMTTYYIDYGVKPNRFVEVPLF
ncbi:MAG TPA: hypothetical protein V6D47_18780 [Oscillatoriaceae cyanobacterium]